MSWDIYGENLAPGHCEVHPWVHQPYPCPVCVNDAKRLDKEERDYIRAMEAMAQEHYAAMERDYIEAHCVGMEGEGI